MSERQWRCAYAKGKLIGGACCSGYAKLMGGAMGAADGGNMQLLMMQINSLAWWEQQGHEPKGRHSSASAQSCGLQL